MFARACTRKALALLAGVFFALTALVGSRALAADSITISGSTTVLPIMQKAVEAFMAKKPGLRMEVAGGGSGNGIKALIDKTTDIAMSSRPLKDKEMEAAKAGGVTPLAHAVALDAVLPLVHPSNPVESLSIDQLRAIYAGQITNWKDVGGKDENIVAVSRDTSSGTYETWQEFVMGKERVSARALLQASSGAVLQTVSKNPKSIGYDGVGYVNDTVKSLKVNGVSGTAETVRSASYPVSRSLYIYTNGQPQGVLAEFIAFLAGPEGQALVKEAGFIPLK